MKQIETTSETCEWVRVFWESCKIKPRGPVRARRQWAGGDGGLLVIDLQKGGRFLPHQSSASLLSRGARVISSIMFYLHFICDLVLRWCS